MSPVALAVHQANEKFYQALQTADLALMFTLWWPDTYVKCTHSGADVVIGWQAVAASWQSYFSTETCCKIVASAIDIHCAGDFAAVSTIETVTRNGHSTQLSGSNLFQYKNNEWRLIHRHETPLTDAVALLKTEKTI